MSLPNQFFSRIGGKLLGDGCITKHGKRQPRFQFIHRIADFDWCNACYNDLKQFIPLHPPTYRKTMDPRLKRGFSESYMVQSRVDPVITDLENLWYTDRVKKIPFDFLDEFLNEEALAWWYQDDGYLKVKSGIPQKIILSTDSFTKDENIQLIRMLNNRFSLSFSIDGQNRLVLYDQIQIIYFLRLVRPYLCLCMDRKDWKSRVQQSLFISAKRTTIYLPKSLNIRHPSKEIQQQLFFLPHLQKLVTDNHTYRSLYIEMKSYFSIKQETKGYQFKFHPKDQYHLKLIHAETGLNNSQIISLCFYLNLDRSKKTLSYRN